MNDVVHLSVTEKPMSEGQDALGPGSSPQCKQKQLLSSSLYLILQYFNSPYKIKTAYKNRESLEIITEFNKELKF